jgi:sugar/nucleoside kinase (ribokinase family)
MLSGFGIEKTLKICNAVSGYTVAHEGARSSPDRKALECFMKEKEG